MFSVKSALISCFIAFALGLLWQNEFYNSLLENKALQSMKEIEMRLQLTNAMIGWKEKGNYVNIYGNNMFYIDSKDDTQNKNEKQNDKIFILIHGFPSSSFDYHLIYLNLTNYGRVIHGSHWLWF